MTQTDVVRIACRALAIYLIVWAISDVLAIPRDMIHVLRYVKAVQLAQAPALKGFENSETYFLRTYVLALAENLLRIALWLLGALWLYRPSPGVFRYFGVRDTQS